MNALALIGSPRKGGNTDVLADAFLEGAAEAGATPARIYLDDLTLRPIGEVVDDFALRVDLRGDDDWRCTAQAVIDTDILAWGAPVYWQGVPAQMKCFVDRWSAYYASDWLNDGMANQVWVTLCCYGHPSQDESHWVVDPVKTWARRWRCQYLGEVSVAVARKGAVAGMQDALDRARKLGQRAVEAHGKNVRSS